MRDGDLGMIIGALWPPPSESDMTHETSFEDMLSVVVRTGYPCRTDGCKPPEALADLTDLS